MTLGVDLAGQDNPKSQERNVTAAEASDLVGLELPAEREDWLAVFSA